MVVHSFGIVYLSWCEILLNNRTILCSLNWNGATIIAAKVNDWMNYNVNAWDRFKSRCHVLLRFRTENEWKQEKRSMTYCFVFSVFSFVFVVSLFFFFPFKNYTKRPKNRRHFNVNWRMHERMTEFMCVCLCERMNKRKTNTIIQCADVWKCSHRPGAFAFQLRGYLIIIIA